MKPVVMQHELTAELENRSGVTGLKLIRLKGSDPSWTLGGLRASPLSPEAENELRQSVIKLQDEIDMA